MASNLWGKIYFNDVFAGILQQEPGGRCVFTYDISYLSNGFPALSFSLPLQEEPHRYEDGLHPFFDNLCAEGWLKNAQARALGLKKSDRFALLLAFGLDLAGAIRVIDPSPVREVQIDTDNPQDLAALSARASLSGIQPKIGVLKDGRKFRAVKYGEHATHIAKLPFGSLPGIIDLEYITTQACKALLKGDAVVHMTIAPVTDVTDKALLIKRFDRMGDGTRLHFEEFNQLLGHKSEDKYDGCYEDMANFILANNLICLKTECDTLFRRIMACILTGNTDAHFKNFAMMHTDQGLRLTPSYDLVASATYPDYQTLALGIERAENLNIGTLKPKNIGRLGTLFGLPDKAIILALADFEKRLPKAHKAIDASNDIAKDIKNNLHQQMEKRWNGTFASIGDYLLKKR